MEMALNFPLLRFATIKKVFLFILGVVPGVALRAEPVQVLVSVLPQVSMVEALGGEHISVTALQAEGDTCSLVDFRPSLMKAVGEADIYFRIGVGLEQALLRRLPDLHPDLRIIDLREGLLLRRYVDDHGSSVSWDPHLWLDPVLLKESAQKVASSLKNLLPEAGPEIEERLAAFEEKVERMHREFSNLLSPHEGKSFFIYHPALGYFADRYGLQQVALESGRESVGLRQIHQWSTRAKEENARVLFVQPEENTASAKALASAIGARVVVIRPLDPDWSRGMKRIATELAAAWESPSDE